MAPRNLDKRSDWLIRQVRFAFRHFPLETLDGFCQSQRTLDLVDKLVNGQELQCVFFRDTKTTIEVSEQPIPDGRGPLHYFAKLPHASVDDNDGDEDGDYDFSQDFVNGQIGDDPLAHLAEVAEQVYQPLLQNLEHKEAWSDTISNEISENLITFIANSQIMVGHKDGVTYLPLPSYDAELEPDLDPRSADDQQDFEAQHSKQIHMLEGALITWTKQIKSVLKLDPEQILQADEEAGPLTEIQFWENKANNLNNIFEQLQSVRIRKVLKILDQTRSTYNAAFAKLCKEVFKSRVESNNNVRFLRPLQPYFEALEHNALIEDLHLHFRPIMHLLLLVWKTSGYYNTSQRLVVCIREVCNTIIRHAKAYLDGDMIFELIESNRLKEIIDMLQTTLRVIGTFKTTYFDYKAKANAECPNNPWRIQHNALFARLDNFLERCHDILELAQAILQYNSLVTIEVGGTKGKTLTASVAQISTDFQAAVVVLKGVGSSIVELSNNTFETSFYNFRNKTKEFDRRLASVIIQGFDDAPSITSRFRLLDTFDSVLQRPTIADQLEKKHSALIAAVRNEIDTVQEIFHAHKANPVTASNSPPIAGALGWSRGLTDRIRFAVDKMQQFSKKLLEREDARDVMKTYTSLLGHIADFERAQLESWAQSIEATSQAKLRNPLLGRHRDSGLIFVNFDPLLVSLLREVKYFLLMGLDVPAVALDIYRKVEMFRRHTGNLELIVNMYNTLQTTLLPVERPLLKFHIERVDKALAPGMDDSRTKTKALSWKSNGVELFITETMQEVKDVNDILMLFKNNLKRVEELAATWERLSLFERQAKTCSLDDFHALQRKVRTQRAHSIKEGGQEIHRLLKDVNKRLKISHAHPDWKAYLDFINDVVTTGLAKMIANSLEALQVHLDPSRTQKGNASPLFEIDLDLRDQHVTFIPELGLYDENDTSQTGVRNFTRGWITGMLACACSFRRIDTGEGTYRRELLENPDVQRYFSQVTKMLLKTEVDANKVREQFAVYEYLWGSDMAKEFEHFLGQAIVTQPRRLSGAGPDRGNNFRANADIVVNLALFDEKIAEFNRVQSEISELRTVHEIDYLRVNAAPIKQTIWAWVAKWMNTYTQFLQDHINQQLSQNYAFNQAALAGLEQTVEGDRASLMAVMTHIMDVKDRIPVMATWFQPIADIIALMKRHAIPLDLAMVGDSNALDYLETAKVQWDNVVSKAFKVKEEIQPRQNSMIETIQRDVNGFKTQLKAFVAAFEAHGLTNTAEYESKEALYAAIDNHHDDLEKLAKRASDLQELEELFELPVSRYEMLADMFDDLRVIKRLWDTWFLVQNLFSSWRGIYWAEIKADELSEEVHALKKLIQQLPKRAKQWAAYRMLFEHTNNMGVILELIQNLHSKAMRDRHWRLLGAVTGKQLERTAAFSFDHILSANLHQHTEEVQDIVDTANKEFKIECKLDSIRSTWNVLQLSFTRHRDTDISVPVVGDDILDALEEHQLQLQNIAGMGKFADFSRQTIDWWQSNLGNVETILKLMAMVQRQWASLEAIFLASMDIRSQLPDDTKRFESIDAEFKDMLRVLQMNPQVIQFCNADGQEMRLRVILKELESCQKALNEYLDVKKSIFPRFYFVSNVALLDILSNGNNPPKIIPHIADIFEGISSLDLVYSETQVALQASATSDDELIQAGYLGCPEAAEAVVAKDGERVRFNQQFLMRGAVENWLNELVSCMHSTLQAVLAQALTDAASWEVDNSREEWTFNFPAQIVLLASQILWTEETEAALEELEAGQEGALRQYRDACAARLDALIRVVQGELTPSDRLKVITLITIDVHNKDIVQSLIDTKVESGNDFRWQCNLRYYWGTEAQTVPVRICDYRALYCFEYIGNCGRLVVTPLTDRCYVTLTTAIRLNMGGAPAGPAGTGKTETTKDLARNLGLPCYVFNCSDQMNYQTLADIFKGLVQGGAWGCFDEFNRIQIEVLSVVATQVSTILEAIRRLAIPSNREPMFQQLPAGSPPTKIGHIDFFGDRISLIPTCGLFITMNPGYAGRTELPENLKALFRPCAMIRPDTKRICENMLMAEGFLKARILSNKFVTLYQLASELLSAQHHYDWGLRAVKSVLQVAGMLRRGDSHLAEDAILMRALRDFNLPKLTVEDTPIFLRLIGDLFSCGDVNSTPNEQLRHNCKEVCKLKGLQPEDGFVAKVLQLQEILQIRHSVMLLGPAGSGKSTVWKTLCACHNHNQSKPLTVFDALNPKAITGDELYGCMTIAKDWKDGVLSIIMRSMSKDWAPYSNHQTSKWIVFDGDIDAMWIESMNSVMDDNKLLTLVSNERIPLTSAMRLMFEVHTLQNATPATVSRAGILYLNEGDIGYNPFVDTWLALKESEDLRNHLRVAFDTHLPAVLGILQHQQLSTMVPVQLISMVQATCYLIDGLLAPLDVQPTGPIIERAFLFACLWGVAGALKAERGIGNALMTFSEEWRSHIKGLKFPDKGTVFDYQVDISNGNTSPWGQSLQTTQYVDLTASAHNVCVPTGQVLRLKYLAKNLVEQGRAVMLVGSAGCGKTVIVRDLLTGLPEDTASYTVNINFFTDSASLQKQLESKIDKRSGRNYGPVNSKKLVCFVDDLNLPEAELYGSQPALALLRQQIDSGCWFDRSDLGLRKFIQDIHFIACMNHKSGSFTIDPRLQRHFMTFGCQPPEVQDLHIIYGSILSTHFSHFSPKIKKCCVALANATVHLQHEISQRFLASVVKFHYQFTMRDISGVVRGLLLSTPEHYTRESHIFRLWVHEATRVFADRMISDAESERCVELISALAKRNMEDDHEDICRAPILFTNFGHPKTEDLTTYLSVASFANFRRAVEEKLQQHNESHAVLDLVLFDQALIHVVRIARILTFSRGHALLIGVGGSGKQSLCRFASSICNCTVSQLAISSTYSMADLKEDIKEMYRKTGVKGEKMVWLCTEAQVLDERFLVFISDLMCTGMVHDLFTDEEHDALLASLRITAKGEGVPDNRESMMQFLVERVLSNLHIVLAFSPAGDLLKQRTRRFPTLLTQCTIDWFHDWPKDALISVAQHFLDTGLETELRDNIAYHMSEVHSSVGVVSADYLSQARRFNYTTPKAFLDLIVFYKRLLYTLRSEMQDSIGRLQHGLQALQRTNQDVERLQETLVVKKAEVDAKKASTDALLEEMGRQRSEAETQQAIADKEKANADAAASEARRIEEVATDDLAIARPALDAAQEAVDCLDKASMTELKSFSKPPPGVDKVTAALLIMIRDEKRDFSWENAKRMMGKLDLFKERLERYDGQNIPDDVVRRVEPLLEDPNFSYEKMKTKSMAAANLCNWVVSTLTFNKVFRRVKPLMDALDAAKVAKEQAEADLRQVEHVLGEIEEKLTKLQTAFLEASQEKAQVEAEAQECETRLQLANRLTKGLESEQERWEQEVSRLQKQELTFVGDALLAASFTSYAGAFTAEYRKKLWLDIWRPDIVAREIPIRPDIEPLQLMADEAAIAEWQNCGLPRDAVSAENAAITYNCARWPLLIDPQQQGLRWLKSTEHKRLQPFGTHLYCVQIGDKGWIRKVINSLRSGDSIIIEDIDEAIDAVLDPVLNRATFRKGKQKYIEIAGEVVEYDDRFRVFLQTRLSNPHYKPEIAAQCTLINFLVNEAGLQDQLLAQIVSREEPKLEQTKMELVQSFIQYKIQLNGLEDQLLERLANAPDDILSDIPLVQGLEATKETATEINLAVERARVTEKEINEARDVYAPVASEGAMLYFTLLQLSSISHMYHFGLTNFVKIFLKGLSEVTAARDKDTRVKSLQLSLRHVIFTWVARGLLDNDKLVFLTQLTFKLLQREIVKQDCGYTSENLSVLLKAPRKLDEVSPIRWLSDAVWGGVVTLSELPRFTKLPGDIEENPSRFLDWYQHATPERERMPLQWRDLDKSWFHKLLVIRYLRPDRMLPALRLFIQEVLPKANIFLNLDAEFSSFQVLEQVYLDSDSYTPVYFLLCPGADTLSDMNRLAAVHKRQKGVDYFNISLGQGQEVSAMERLTSAHVQGHWVVLNNIHLMPRWLPLLEKVLKGFAQDPSHPEFRVFLSSEFSPSIPVGLLEHSLKITNDPPSGLKSNMKAALCSFSSDEYDDMEPRTRGIVFGLCYFHAIMVERNKFGPKGFNVKYPFSIGDLFSSVAVLRTYMENASGKIPWTDLRYLFGEIMYGGHIVDDFDRLVCGAYLNYFMRDELLDELPLFPYFESEAGVSGFTAPALALPYEKVLEQLEQEPDDVTPLAFGMHPNAEIGFRTELCENTLNTILRLGGDHDSSSSAAGNSGHVVAESRLHEILEQFRDVKLDIETVGFSLDEFGPFQYVLIQEATRMNDLLALILASLTELDRGLKGDLSMSDDMDSLQAAMSNDLVPLQWSRLAFPSMRGLGSWLMDIQARINQLQDWLSSPGDFPPVTWLGGLFHPQSFLTAVCQSTAQTQSMDLDRLQIFTDITKKKSAEEVGAPAKDGAFVIGLYLEGASWNLQSGVIEASKPRALVTAMPVINVKAVATERIDSNCYLCPVYQTQRRGPTFVFMSQLKCRGPAARWTLAGVAMVMDVNE